MCTNYRLAIVDQDRLANWFGPFSMSEWLNPDVDPTREKATEFYPKSQGPVIHAGSRVLAWYRWGFDNFLGPNRPLVNAKAETVSTLRTFNKAFASTRCLVPATGFYDYRGSDPVGKKRRYLFTTGEELFSFAGLWEKRAGVRNYTLLTCEPNAVVKEYHHRMPVILPKAAYEVWLDPKSTQDELLALLRPWDWEMTATEAPKAAKPKAEKPAKEPKAKKKPADEGGGLFG